MRRALEMGATTRVRDRELAMTAATDGIRDRGPDAAPAGIHEGA